ncbi:MAG: helix-turn-helix transcriptional regulator [Bacilli bacterium]|nr:helix-turn-helix transcriptional regulator [Bacilli bacterium]
MTNYNCQELIIYKEELAKMLEVSCVSVNRYENGHNELTIKVKRRIIKLCNENGIEVD